MAAIVIIVIVAVAGYTVLSRNTALQQSSSAPSTTQAYTSTQVSGVATTIPTTVNNTNKSVETYTMNVASNSALGTYLTNATGWTVYLYTVDKPYSGNSACYGSCATYWHAFYTANLTVPSSLNASNFGTITRIGGAKQLTYKGWPLYVYAGDRAAYQTNGQGLLGTWYVVTVPVLKNIPNSSSTTTQQATTTQATTSTSGYGGYG